MDSLPTDPGTGRFDWLFEEPEADAPSDRELSIDGQRHAAALPTELDASLTALTGATALLARLDERLNGLPDFIRDGWIARMLLEEAAASARLEGWIVDVERLLLLSLHAAVGAPDPHEAQALHLLDMLRAVSRRSPRQLFTARRISALAFARERNRTLGPVEWVEMLPDKGRSSVEALRDYFDGFSWSSYGRQPAVGASADMLARWHRCGTGAAVGGAAGRAMANAALVRLGLCGRLLPCISIGFLGEAWSYRPGKSDWPYHFSAAAERGARRGLELAARLQNRHEALTRHFRTRRQERHLGAAVAHLIAMPAVAARGLAGSIGITQRSALSLLMDLADAGLLRDLTRRGSYRVFGLTGL